MEEYILSNLKEFNGYHRPCNVGIFKFGFVSVYCGLGLCAGRRSFGVKVWGREISEGDEAERLYNIIKENKK
jgi:hypothetical protein